jgi:hypothetical protein
MLLTVHMRMQTTDNERIRRSAHLDRLGVQLLELIKTGTNNVLYFTRVLCKLHTEVACDCVVAKIVH